MSKTVIHYSKRLYAVLLELYPRSYQQEFKEEMRFVFSESLQDAYAESGDRGIITLWVRTIIDAGKSLITQHLENQKGREHMKSNKTFQKSFTRVALVTAGILMIPLLAMQVSSDVDWKLPDFVIIGVLLMSIGLLIEFVRHKVHNQTHQVILIIGLVLLCLYIWAELAVGIFTNLGS